MTEASRDPIEAIRARRAKVDGPWRLTRRYPMMLGYAVALQRPKDVAYEAETGQVFGLLLGREHDLPMETFEFIAHAPQDIDTLFAALDQVRQQLAEAQSRTGHKEFMRLGKGLADMEARAIHAENRAEAAESKLAAAEAHGVQQGETIRALTHERDEYRTLARVGPWHNDCRPNRHKAAEEIEKSQARIDQLADKLAEQGETITRLQIALEDVINVYPQVEDWETVKAALAANVVAETASLRFPEER